MNDHAVCNGWTVYIDRHRDGYRVWHRIWDDEPHFKPNGLDMPLDTAVRFARGKLARSH